MADDSLRKLLNDETEIQSETINENDISNSPISINEIDETNTDKQIRKKFIVIKHTDNNNEFQKSNELQSQNKQKNNFDNIDAQKDEIDDVFEIDDENFNTNLNYKSSSISTNRYTEGEDTITSLKNSVFVRQLAEMKRRASLKSQNSIKSSNNQQSNDTQSDTLTPPIVKPNRTNQFFKSHESIKSKKSAKSLQVNNAKSQPHSPKPHQSNNKQNKISIGRSIENLVTTAAAQFLSTGVSNTNMQGSNHPDAIIDTITEAINNNKNDEDYKNLMRQIKYLLAQNEKIERRRRAYFKRTFKIIACFLLFFTFLMGILVITSVIIQINEIESIKSNRTSKYRLLYGPLVSNLTDSLNLFHKKPHQK